MTGKQLDEVGLAGKIPGIPGPEFRLAWVMPQAGGLMGSGKWRHPQVRVAATGPLGCKPFWPLDDGEKWILECGESGGTALVVIIVSSPEASFTSVCLLCPSTPPQTPRIFLRPCLSPFSGWAACVCGVSPFQRLCKF